MSMGPLPSEQVQRVGDDVDDRLETFERTAGDPGRLTIRLVPQVPATPRDSRPSGLADRMASARPGASRSSTARVPSGA